MRAAAAARARPRLADARATWWAWRAALFGRGKRLGAPKSIVITGATAGIGEAFALHYAKPGVTLTLTGRNTARLNEVASACESRCGGWPCAPACSVRAPAPAKPTARGAASAHAPYARLLRAPACASGAKVKKGVLDVTDKDGMAKFLLSVDKEAPVECARACANRESDPPSRRCFPRCVAPLPTHARALPAAAW